MRIIPAIDIIEGKCVRLTKGNYASKIIYNENPLEVAKQFEGEGLKYLHLVDLEGARLGHVVNHRILERIAAGTNLRIDFGGGIKTTKDIETVFDYGAHQVCVGSVAIKDEQLFINWLNQYGAEKIILGADFVNRKISITGWQKVTDIDVKDFIQQYEHKGIQYVLCTDVSRDGMLQGPSLDIYDEVLKCTNVKLIASGGISSLDDLKQLKTIGCEAAIVGKALYEGKIKVSEITQLL
ncbi:MAG: 1-(5-phosphoribosyl)-5-[(5-phosphoribosylamino)methylideneamino]imidazole-4-carboxamide isomerase [Chitinophagales bacterium]|nr:1-(5-phosphoribosyl)-5-[(5-phosphoribosylamino)methylideneamino]imidazole-4-carboxamide isomerase [Chitinophagales bacterium]